MDARNVSAARDAAAAAASTIAAVASPPGPGARGIVRVSGPRAAAILRALLTARTPDLAARRAFAGRIHDGRGEQPVHVLWMPGPRSFTREDVLELHLRGARPLLAAAYARVLDLGAEPAPPGEFTRRAFLAGRIDLLRAEGVLSLVAARDEAERRAATALLFGGLSERVGELRDALSDARALVEASLDFDETDTGHVDDAEVEAVTGRAAALVARALAWETQRGATLAEPRVVLAGAPNAGKSSLFNALTGALTGASSGVLEPASATPGALVSHVAGTTRDTLGASWPLARGVVRLVDTAGLGQVPATGSSALDAMAAQAQELARLEREAADLVLWVVDASRAAGEVLVRERAALGDGMRFLLVWNQVDRPGARAAPDAELLARLGIAPADVVASSALTGLGLDALARASAARVVAEEGSSGAGEVTGVVRELSARHRRALESAAAELDRARVGRAAGEPLDLFAAGLRAATDELDGITGRTTPDDVLDRVFERFCIGK